MTETTDTTLPIPEKPAPVKKTKIMNAPMITIVDDVTFTGDEIIIRNTKTIHLKLAGEKGRERLIGTIDIEHDWLMVERKRDKHLHRKSLSYGFNEYLIKNAKAFKNIMLHDESGYYLIPLDVIKENGKYLFFKQQGFEVQLFLELEIIKKYKHKPLF